MALEDLDIEAYSTGLAAQWADQITAQLYPESVAQYQQWRDAVKARFVILPDDIFSFQRIPQLKYEHVFVLIVNTCCDERCTLD
jgi:hypothetical protein